MIGGNKTKDNPAAYCIECGKFIGCRGFCSEKCHNKHYDVNVATGEGDRK